jgi:octaprenyl-diphosphate synthase
MMLLLEQVSAEERTSIIDSLRGAQSVGLAASRQRMKDLGIAAGIVRAIDDELVVAFQALAPFAHLAPVPLMRQLGVMLQTQVASLQGAT